MNSGNIPALPNFVPFFKIKYHCLVMIKMISFCVLPAPAAVVQSVRSIRPRHQHWNFLTSTITLSAGYVLPTPARAFTDGLRYLDYMCRWTLSTTCTLHRDRTWSTDVGTNTSCYEPNYPRIFFLVIRIGSGLIAYSTISTSQFLTFDYNLLSSKFHSIRHASLFLQNFLGARFSFLGSFAIQVVLSVLKMKPMDRKANRLKFLDPLSER